MSICRSYDLKILHGYQRGFRPYSKRLFYSASTFRMNQNDGLEPRLLLTWQEWKGRDSLLVNNALHLVIKQGKVGINEVYEVHSLVGALAG